MPAQPPRKFRRWLIVFLLILLASPLVIMAIFKAIFLAHGLRADQFTPPTTALKLSPAPDPKFKTYDDLIASAPNQDALSAYGDWLKNESDGKWITRFNERKPGQPLTLGEIQWLRENDDLTSGLLAIATTGAMPMLTCEQVLGGRYSLPYPAPATHLFLYFARVLAAESRRRLDANDPAGAAEALMAIHQLAFSIREPAFLNHAFAVGMQTMANLELADWLSNRPLAPDLARRMRDQLSKTLIDSHHLRRVLEIFYLNQRAEGVRLLNGSFLDVVNHNMNIGDESFSAYPKYFLSQPRTATVDLAKVTLASFRIKCSASVLLDRYDAYFSDRLTAIDDNRPVVNDMPRNLPFFIGIIFIDEIRTRTTINFALQQLDIAALNLIAGDNPTTPSDPFATTPLKTVRTTDSTLIYSLGPDHTDQHGTLTYDPTNGTFSTGDITLRLPTHR